MVATLPSTQTGRRRPVCVLTTQTDVTADRVIGYLNRMNTPLLRIDLADFPHSVELDATCDNGRWVGTLTTADGRCLRLEDVGAVWWWHPGSVNVVAGTAAESAWASRETSAGLSGVLASLDALHVNHPVSTYAAQAKAIMLARAARFGLRVPGTWIGNRPLGAREFATSTTDVVTKSLVDPVIPRPSHGNQKAAESVVGSGCRRSTERRILYTTPICAAAIDDSVRLMAHQLQRRVHKDYEVRLVVIGQAIFSVRIDAHSPAAKRDFRADYGSLTYRTTDVPNPVRSSVKALMGHYGLVTAALDFLVDADGQWHFVDCNSAGHYGWLEAHLPLGASEALARLLADPSASGTRSLGPCPT